MKLVRRKDNYNPFYELEKLHNELSSLFDWSFGANSFPERQCGLMEAGWAPAVDMRDAKDSIIVKADIPGLNKDEINVTIQNNTLIISGEKKQENEEKDKGYVRTERFFGTFYRAITLPADVDAEKTKAEYKNGTLELTLPKREEAKPKQITVDIK